MKPFPDVLKQGAGRAWISLDKRCRFENCLFILGHMRCGSTALSNILVSRPEVSGYGEAHVTYGSRAALGQLALNQLRRGGFKAGARLLFDKILHDRYDAAADPGFFAARAVFVARAPEDAILSIRTLFETLEAREYASDAAAADYLAARMETLLALWQRFPPDRRLAFTHAAVIADPDAAVARLSRFGGFDPPLANSYSAAARKGAGAGDPINAHRFSKIMPGTSASAIGTNRRPIEVEPRRLQQLQALYQAFEAFCHTQHSPGSMLADRNISQSLS
ncbi:MAG: sulfotransferase [Sandaracinobacteroides sp.]